MEGYISRRYLAEKYEKIKTEAELHLKLLDGDVPDELTEDEVKGSYGVMKNNMTAFLRELEKGIEE